MGSISSRTTERALATDGRRLADLFGHHEDLLPLWIAEPYVELAEPVRSALAERAAVGWYGYEARPDTLIEAFWQWADARHGWTGDGLTTTISPSVGTSIGVLLEQFTKPGEAVLLQPPVFTDFKPLIRAANRPLVRSSLQLESGRYTMDFADLEEKTADPSTKAMILCNPHNPVGRCWTADELRQVADVCAANDVFVIADEIHADLVLPGHRFVPFAAVAGEVGVSWAALHGPIKTFGLAGVCDTLLITDSEEVTAAFRTESSRLHLTRNNVFALAAFEAAYTEGGEWLDGFLADIADNFSLLEDSLPSPLGVVAAEATFLAWLDLRGLGLDVPELSRWLADSGLALSPGHWFGREGAGFARMTMAAEPAAIRRAAERLAAAI